MTIRASFPSLRPSLDLHFARTKRLDPRVTFSRDDSQGRATYVDAGGVLRTAAIGAPRFDHNPSTGESLGLLVEEARTNLLLRSEEFDNASWAKIGTTVTPNAGQSPSGATTADLLEVTASGGSKSLYVPVTALTSSTAYSISFYVKAATSSSVAIGALSGGSWLGLYSFTLSGSGATSPIIAGVNSAITNNGNGWYRCQLTILTTGTSFDLLLYPNTTGNSIGNSVYLWGAQLEAGAFPTSYIKTEAATATRAADVASITGTNFSSWYRQDEGTAFSSFSIPTAITTGGSRVYNINNAAATSQIWLRLQAGSNRLYEVTDSSVVQASLSAGTFAANTTYKGAAAAKVNDFAFSDNGSLPVTDTSGSLGTVDRLGIGMDATGIAPLNGHIRRLTFWPQRLPDATLQALTR